MAEFLTGNGADWLDLLSTLRGRYRAEQVEMLSDPAQLQAWLAEHALAPSTPATDDDVREARRLREALHRTATAVVRSQPPAPPDVRVLQEALAADRPLRIRLAAEGLSCDPPADVQEAMARLARQAASDLTGPAAARLHACGDGTCSGIFLDHTGRRRWCLDERCGVRSRVRAHRARTRHTAAPGDA